MERRQDNFWKIFSIILLVLMAGLVGVVVWQSAEPDYPFHESQGVRSSLAAFTSPLSGGENQYWVADLADKTLPMVVNIRTEMEAPKADPHSKDLMQEWQQMLPGPLGEGMQQQLPQGHPDLNGPQDESPAGGEGSGFIIREDGYIVTNDHVVEGGKKFTVRMYDGRELPAKLIGVDQFKDIAVLKVEADKLPVAILGDSAKTRIGEPVIAIGSPLGYQATVTAGIISTNNRTLEDLGRADDVRKPQTYLQTDAAINRGNSGGPLINSHGEVIGVNQAIARWDPISPWEQIPIEGIGFAIPISEVKSTIKAIVENGKVVYPGMSAKITSVEDFLASHPNVKDMKVKEGVYIDSVTVNGPAYKAGLQAGDVVLTIAGVKVTDGQSFIKEIQNHAVGDRVTLRVARQGKEKQEDVSVVLEELDISNMRPGD